jgi:hypothetical protein
MNVRFRTLETEDKGSNIVRLPSSLWNPYKQPSNLGAIPWDEDVPDEADKEIDSRTIWGPTTSDEQSATELFLGTKAFPTTLIRRPVLGSNDH